MSGLNNYLVDLLRGITLGGLLPVLYCDGIFAVLACILPRWKDPTPQQKLLNLRMSAEREGIEHIFSDHYVHFGIFRQPQLLRLFSNGVKVRKICLVSWFILNCYYCLNGNRSEYFGQISPTLDDYIPLDEEIDPPPAVHLSNVWDYN